MRKNHQQKENTTYIDGCAVLFFDGMSKERKQIQKGQSAICEGLEKYKKHTKIQIAFLDVMDKKYKNTKCMVLDGFGLFRRSNGSFGIQDWYLGESDTLGCLDVSNSPSSNWQALGPPKQNNQDIVHQLIVS